jgi:hypothetical protein
MEQKLFFLHIPKCGGTSLDAALRTLYGDGRECLRFYAHAHADAAKLIDVDERRLIEYALFYFLSHRHARYVSGHFPFSENAHRTFAGAWDFITLLRHPVERWYSQYFYNRFKVHEHFRITEELPAFIDSPRAPRLANASILQLTARGIDEILARPFECAGDAIAVLDKFALVGCLERLDAFVDRFENRYGSRLTVPRLQVNPAPPSLRAAPIDSAIRRRVEEICEADLLVYEHALSRC